MYQAQILTSYYSEMPYEIVVPEQLYEVMGKKFGNIWKEEWKNIRTFFIKTTTSYKTN